MDDRPSLKPADRRLVTRVRSFCARAGCMDLLLRSDCAVCRRECLVRIASGRSDHHSTSRAFVRIGAARSTSIGTTKKDELRLGSQPAERPGCVGAKRQQHAAAPVCVRVEADPADRRHRVLLPHRSARLGHEHNERLGRRRSAPGRTSPTASSAPVRAARPRTSSTSPANTSTQQGCITCEPASTTR